MQPLDHCWPGRGAPAVKGAELTPPTRRLLRPPAHSAPSLTHQVVLRALPPIHQQLLGAIKLLVVACT